jgi:hypothetical protein
MRAYLRLGVALVAAGAILAGCGSSSSKSSSATTAATTSSTATPSASFKQSFRTVTGELKQTSGAIGTAFQTAQSKTDAQLATILRGLASRWQSQASQLQALQPPSNVAAEFSTLTAAASRVGPDLNTTATAVGNHSAGSAKRSTISILRDILAAKAAAQAIDRKLGIK